MELLFLHLFIDLCYCCFIFIFWGKVLIKLAARSSSRECSVEQVLGCLCQFASVKKAVCELLVIFTIDIIFGFHNAQFLSITRLIVVYGLSIIVRRSSSYAFLLVAVFNKVPRCCIHFYHFCSLHDELSSVLEAVTEIPISYYWLLLSSLTSLLQLWRLGTEPLHSCQRNCR